MSDTLPKPPTETARRRPPAPPTDAQEGYWDGHAPAQDAPAEAETDTP